MVDRPRSTRSGPARVDLPAGPDLPRTVQTLRWLLDGPRFMRRTQERFGPVFTLDLHPVAVGGPGAGHDSGRWVLLADPDHIKQVFRADPRVALTGRTNMFLQHIVGPESILVLDEPEHMRQRRLLLAPLHGPQLQRYAELMAHATLREIRSWPVNEAFALWPRMQSITLDVIVRAVFGISAPAEIARFQALLARLLDGMTSTRFLLTHGVRAMLGGPDAVDYTQSPAGRRLLGPVNEAVLDEVVRRRSSADLDERTDILSALLRTARDDGPACSDQQLRDELITLLIAGHESTSTMLAWTFERLLRHPEPLERVRAEAAAGGTAYAEAVVKETLRLRPVLPIVLRTLAAPLDVGGHTLPAGTWLAPCAYLVHRDPDVYPEPEQFRPERFLDDRPTTYQWTPFGGGARRCLGASFAQLEMRVVLQTVLTHVDLRSADTSAERIRRRFITHTPSRGARVVMTGRLPQPPVVLGPAAGSSTEGGCTRDPIVR